MVRNIVAYTSVGLLALPSDFDRAMREASERRTVTDTDSCAFPILTNSQREDDRGIMKIYA